MIPTSVQERRCEDLGHAVNFAGVNAQLVQLMAAQLIKKLQHPESSKQQQHDKGGPARARRRPICHHSPSVSRLRGGACRATSAGSQPAWRRQTSLSDTAELGQLLLWWSAILSAEWKPHSRVTSSA